MACRRFVGDTRGRKDMKDRYILDEINNLDMMIQNPARLMIVYLLENHDQMDYIELMDRTRLTSGNISTHINKLAESGYVLVHKSFKGKKPNTSIELTEMGRRAYHQWGESIICALPMRIRPRLKARLMQSEIMFECEKHLIKTALTDSWQDVSLLPEQFLRRFSMPPMLALHEFYS